MTRITVHEVEMSIRVPVDQLVRRVRYDADTAESIGFPEVAAASRKFADDVVALQDAYVAELHEHGVTGAGS